MEEEKSNKAPEPTPPPAAAPKEEKGFGLTAEEIRKNEEQHIIEAESAPDTSDSKDYEDLIIEE